MINSISVIISIVLSVLAFLVSVGNLYLEKRKVIAQSLVTERIEWLNKVRQLMVEFIENYYLRADPSKLQVCKLKIELYTRRDSSVYEKLNELLNACTEDTEFNKERYDELIEECQKVLNSTWIRIKLESGMSRKDDKKIYQLFEKLQK